MELSEIPQAVILNTSLKPIGTKKLYETESGTVIGFEKKGNSFLLTHYRRVPRELWNEGA